MVFSRDVWFIVICIILDVVFFLCVLYIMNLFKISFEKIFLFLKKIEF